jgi:hypothetical protein
VAAGVPFCPQCNAPQIRVVSEAERVQESSAAPSVDPASGATFEAASPRAIRWSAAIVRTVVAAVATTAMLQLAANLTHSAGLAFMAMPLGGWFAAYLYSRRLPGPVTAGMGARLGAVTGFFVFLLGLTGFAVQYSTHRQELFDAMQKTLKDAVASSPNPQKDAIAQQLSTPEGMMAVLFISAILFLFMSVIFCAIGGAAGAGLMNRRSD